MDVLDGQAKDWKKLWTGWEKDYTRNEKGGLVDDLYIGPLCTFLNA